jgi:hypothetical protein
MIRRYDRETLAGYVNPLSFVQPEGVELLSEQANVAIVPFPEIRWLGFVREFDSGSAERHVFHTRPKTPGLWVSLRFRDGELLEGILPNNLLLLESAGFTVIPPDPFGNLQRLWVPRGSLVAVEVLGVVGSPLRRRKAKESKDQIGLFEEPAAEDEK